MIATISDGPRVVPPPELLKGLTGPRLKTGAWIPIRRDGDTITVAMKDPHDLPQVDGIERLFAGRKVKVAVALAEDIAKLIGAGNIRFERHARHVRHGVAVDRGRSSGTRALLLGRAVAHPPAFD